MTQRIFVLVAQTKGGTEVTVYNSRSEADYASVIKWCASGLPGARDTSEIFEATLEHPTELLIPLWRVSEHAESGVWIDKPVLVGVIQPEKHYGRSDTLKMRYETLHDFSKDGDPISALEVELI
jgi:hypothetical protein